MRHENTERMEREDAHWDSIIMNPHELQRRSCGAYWAEPHTGICAKGFPGRWCSLGCGGHPEGGGVDGSLATSALAPIALSSNSGSCFAHSLAWNACTLGYFFRTVAELCHA